MAISCLLLCCVASNSILFNVTQVKKNMLMLILILCRCFLIWLVAAQKGAMKRAPLRVTFVSFINCFVVGWGICYFCQKKLERWTKQKISAKMCARGTSISICTTFTQYPKQIDKLFNGCSVECFRAFVRSSCSIDLRQILTYRKLDRAHYCGC